MAKTQIPKSQKKALRRKQEQREHALLAFLADYGNPEPAQKAESATFDNQLKSLTTLLTTELDKSTQGTIIDLGCGNGVLLSRMTELPAFTQSVGWNYVGIDYPEYKESVFKVAFQTGVHRRVDFLDLSTFYAPPTLHSSLPRPHIVFARNVIHELTIRDTVRLLEAVARNLVPGEIFVVQDLQVFPKAEKGNACWISTLLTKVLIECGFNASETIEQSYSGNRWVNIIATRNSSPIRSYEDVHAAVVSARREQWNDWRSLGALHSDDEKFRDVTIAKIDFDLQFAALNNQLLEARASGVEPLSRDQEAIVLKDTFKKALSDFTLTKPADIREIIDDIAHFVDRGNSQNSLEKFLASDYAVATILGPTLMGKTDLVRHVLSKFRHERVPVLVDVQATASVWNLLEAILSSIRCQVSNEILVNLQGITFSDIRPMVSDFFESHARNLVIAFDHFERLLNPLGHLSDGDIRDLLTIVAGSSHAKVIVTSRRAPQLLFLQPNLFFPEPQPPVGRFPEGPLHVEQLLGTFVGLKSYPTALLDAIDRHPLLAVLAGLYLRKVGKTALDDQAVLTEMRQNMRNAVFSRIVDEESRPAIISVSRLRIPVPRNMIISLSSDQSVRSAENVGLLFAHRDLNRSDLISCVGALRIRAFRGTGMDGDDDDLRTTDAAEESSVDVIEAETQSTIAVLYEQLYRQDDDPKWLREAFYHQMLIGDVEALNRFGVNFRSEIFGAGEYWFRHKKDFHSALWAFQAAQRYGDASLLVRMRIASCRMRTKKQREGEDDFIKLMEEFPEAIGIKSSYIDGLLFIKEYQRALDLLQNFGFALNDGAWVAGQYGRAYMGLQLHREAIQAFNHQILLDEDPLAYRNLARAYHRLGATDDEKRVLERALRVFSHSRSLQLAYASVLERTGRVEEASERLERLLRAAPNDGWVMFPLIRALVKAGEREKALRIWSEGQDKLDPELLRKPIQAALSVDRGKYEDALAVLRTVAEDEHSVGQRLEIYSSWANSLKNVEEQKAIAVQGLKELEHPLQTNLNRNVPLLLSYAKLLLLAGKNELYNSLREKILEINPSMEKVIADMDSSWHEETLSD